MHPNTSTCDALELHRSPRWSSFNYQSAPPILASSRKTRPVNIISPPEVPAGIEAVYLANREKLVRFLRTRGAGDSAEDIFHELWLKIVGKPEGPIANPLAYLYRAADMLMIDRYRSQRQSDQRDQAWSAAEGEGGAAKEPSIERTIAAKQEARQVAVLLAGLGSRRETVFRRARIEGVSHRQIAADLGISLSTVESDLRIACQALIDLKERMR